MERALYWVRQLDAKTDMLANVHVYNVENYQGQKPGQHPDPGVRRHRGCAHCQRVQARGGHPARRRGPWAAWVVAAAWAVWVAPVWVVWRQQRSGAMGGTMSGASGTAGPGVGFGGGTVGTPGGEAGGASPLKERATGAGAEGAALKEGVRVIPDEENNLLVVVAPPHEWNIISRILKDLDVMPRQVLNEGLIAEVRLTVQPEIRHRVSLGGRPLRRCKPRPAPAPAAPPQPSPVFWWPAKYHCRIIDHRQRTGRRNSRSRIPKQRRGGLYRGPRI